MKRLFLFFFTCLMTIDHQRKLRFLYFLLFILGSANIGGAQIAPNETISNPVDSLWSQIETKLDLQASDTSYHFMRLYVRDHCGHNYDCLRNTYYGLMFKFEQHFNLFAATYMCRELLKLAQLQENLPDEANAFLDLNRYHSALGNERLAAMNIDKALQLFVSLDDQSAIIYAKMMKLEQSLSYQSLEDVLPEMDELLNESIPSNDSISIIMLHRRLIQHKIDARHYAEAEYHINALERIVAPNPTHVSEIGTILKTTLGRADIARGRKELNEAEKYYLKALAYCEDVSDRWMEIHILHSLSELEWERGNTELAKSYLGETQEKAETLQLHDLLMQTFGLQAKIAEEEGRYADALFFIKKQLFHEEKFEERSKGFDIRNYYLQLENEELVAEKTNRDLQLSLKDTQLRYSTIIIVLVILLAAGLFVGMYKHRRGMKKLAVQNTLIHQQTKQLENLDAAKSRFYANVSHELRTPLSLILGPIGSLIKEKNLTEKQLKMLKMAEQSGKNLEQLVQEILDLRKLEMGKMKLNLQPVKLSSFFMRYLVQFESLAQRKKVDFLYQILAEEDQVVNIDPEKYRQLLYNLLANAFKFTPSGGRIEVILTLKDSILQLMVSDSGAGIHPDDLPHVFDRYFQTNRPDKAAEGGTGIGLALCQEYAHLFGGTIEVESTLGKETIFRIKFPVSIVEPEQKHLNKEVELAKSLENNSQEDNIELISPVLDTPPKTNDDRPIILVVEDNPDLQDYIRIVLSEKYRVISAENGKTALEYLHQNPNCQLILSDLMMPVMDGYQLLKKLKSDDATRHIPVIMLTARAEAQDKLKALRIGVDDYLIKPFDEEELLVRIENLLKNQSARNPETPTEIFPKFDKPLFSKRDQAWLETFESYIQKNLSKDILSISLLAKEFAMSESTLLRQLKRLTGLSPSKYLQEMRLDMARQMLENRSYKSISTIATKVGYSDSRSFSRSFKNRFGKLPSKYLDN